MPQAAGDAKSAKLAKLAKLAKFANFAIKWILYGRTAQHQDACESGFYTITANHTRRYGNVAQFLSD